MQNVFDLIAKANAQKAKTAEEQEDNVPDLDTGEATSESAVMAPFKRRTLTPPAKPGDKGYSHKEQGQCPVCGIVGQLYVLPGPITVTFCPTHRVSLPVPENFSQ